jgi:hypothetical protein
MDEACWIAVPEKSAKSQRVKFTAAAAYLTFLMVTFLTKAPPPVCTRHGLVTARATASDHGSAVHHGFTVCEKADVLSLRRLYSSL